MGFWSFVKGCLGLDFVVMASSREPNTDYYCFPSKIKCTCPDWKKRRSNFLRHNPRRLCKHLMLIYDKLPNPPECETPQKDKILDMCRKHGAGFPLTEEERMYETPAGFLIIRPSSSSHPKARQWRNVYIDGEYYSFNTKRGEWSHKTGRPQDWAIIEPYIYGHEAQLPTGIITTVSRKLYDGWKAKVSGEMAGEKVFVDINTRGKWQSVKLPGGWGRCDPEGKRLDIAPKLQHCREAVLAWVAEEKEKVREEMKVQKAAKKKQPAKKQASR